ncbi:MAG: HAD-IIA family hydrolase [Actinomycetales bacterium]
MSGLVESHDVLLVDLDGTVYLDHAAIPFAVESLIGAMDRGARLAFVTNNAARTPASVAQQLRGMGLPARDQDVVTSSMAAASLVRARVGTGATVLAVGGEGVGWALREQGLVPTDHFTASVSALVQGYGPDVRVRDLSEAAFAVAAGVPWIATNDDLLLPTSRGLAPGNGSLLRLVSRAAGRGPDAVAGKPEAALIEEALRRTDAQRPLIVGDRLDTDIAAGVRLGIPTLLVLTGVTGSELLRQTAPEQRPTFVAADLRALVENSLLDLPGFSSR